MTIGPKMIKVGSIRYREEDAMLLGIHPSLAKSVRPGKPTDTEPGDGEPASEPIEADVVKEADEDVSGDSDTEPGDGEPASEPDGAGAKAPKRRKPGSGAKRSN